jgi:uncharacterized membrane protein
MLFVIRKVFLVPLGLLLLLTLLLLAVVINQGQPTSKIIILGLIILPVAILFLESISRRVYIDAQGVTVARFLRKRTIAFADLTAIDTLQVRKRAFITLSTEEQFLILSNAYANFPELVRALLTHVPEGVVSAETRQMAKAPPVKSTDVISCWLAVALLAIILYLQLRGAMPR